MHLMCLHKPGVFVLFLCFYIVLWNINVQYREFLLLMQIFVIVRLFYSFVKDTDDVSVIKIYTYTHTNTQLNIELNTTQQRPVLWYDFTIYFLDCARFIDVNIFLDGLMFL